MRGGGVRKPKHLFSHSCCWISHFALEPAWATKDVGRKAAVAVSRKGDYRALVEYFLCCCYTHRHTYPPKYLQEKIHVNQLWSTCPISTCLFIAGEAGFHIQLFSGITLGGVWGPYGVLGIKPRWTICKACCTISQVPQPAFFLMEQLKLADPKNVAPLKSKSQHRPLRRSKCSANFVGSEVDTSWTIIRNRVTGDCFM